MANDNKRFTHRLRSFQPSANQSSFLVKRHKHSTGSQISTSSFCCIPYTVICLANKQILNPSFHLLSIISLFPHGTSSKQLMLVSGAAAKRVSRWSESSKLTSRTSRERLFKTATEYVIVLLHPSIRLKWRQAGIGM